MQNYKNFTEKPKGREAEIADDEEDMLLHERLEDIDDDFEDDDDFLGMNDYYPYAGYEGGEY